MDEYQTTTPNGEGGGKPRPKERGLLVTLVAVLLLGLGGLGAAHVQLQEQHEATVSALSSVEAGLWQSKAEVARLEGDLAEKSDQLRTCRAEFDEVSASFSDAVSTIRSVESSLGLSRNRNSNLSEQIDDLASQIDELSARYRSCSSSIQEAASETMRWKREAVRLAGELDECVDIANDRLRRINACIESANSGILWLTDIPPEGFSVFFGDPYEELRQKYNDLVGRFNAAINRCNDLSSLLARSLQALE